MTFAQRSRVARAAVFVFVIATLVLPSTGAALAGGSITSGSYKGAVGPGYPLTFTVSSSGPSINDLVVSFDETCNGAPADTPPKFHFKTLSVTDGKFSGASTDHFGKTASDALQIKGTISGDKASGTVSSKSFIKSLGSCSEVEPFNATLKK